ncbi:hypothetical protein ACFL0L_02720 [Patescibacteria group bacterium]
MHIKKRHLQKTVVYIGIFAMLAYLVPPVGNIQMVRAVTPGQLTNVSASLSNTTKGVSSNITVTFTTENDLSGSGSGDVIRVNFDMFRSGNPTLSSMKVGGTSFSGYSSVYGYYYYSGYFEVYLDENINSGSEVEMVISGMTNSESYNRELISIVTFSPDSGGTAYENCTDAGGDDQSFGDCSPFKVWLPLGTPSVSGQILGPISTADATKGYSETYVGMWNSSSYWDSTSTDHLGKFYFYDTPTGSHQVEASIPWGISFPYSAPVKQTISVTSGSTTDMGILRYQFPSVTGVVKSEQTGDPLDGANVYFQNSMVPGANTGSDGRFYLPATSTGTYYVSFSAWGISDDGNYVAPDPIAVSVTNGATYDMGTVYFATPMKTIKGYVKKPDGTAAENAQVECSKPMGGEYMSADVGAGGYYELLVGKGNWNCMVNKNWSSPDAEFDWVYFDMPVPITFSLENNIIETKTHNFTVTPVNSSITGKVLKPDGSVYTGGGLNVDVYTQIGFGSWAQVDPATGIFTADVPAGTYQVMINLWDDNWGGPSPRTISVGANETKNLGTLYLVPKSAAIAGTVTDTNGNALDNQFVDCYVPSEWGKWASGPTDVNGDFSFSAYGQATYFCQPMTNFGGYGGEEVGDQYIYLGAPVSAPLPNVNSSINNVDFEMTRADSTIQVTTVDGNGNQVEIFGFAFIDQGIGGIDGGFGYMGPGLGGPIDNGTGSFKVPSSMCTASSPCNLNIGTPPGDGNEWSSAGAVSFSATQNSTTNVELLMLPHDATVSGKIIDGDGNAITGATANVFADNFESMTFTDTRVNPIDGTYSMSLAAGDYNLGVWLDPTLGYVSGSLGNTQVTAISGQTVTKNLTLRKIDSYVNVTVKDPQGNPMPGAFVDISTSSGKQEAGPGGFGGPGMGGFMGPGMMGQMTGADGTTQVGVPGGTASSPITYYISTALPPGYSYISPSKQTLSMVSGETLSVTMQFRESDAVISGSTTIDGSAAVAYVTAWAEEGGRVETSSFGGGYSLNITQGDTWHVTAKSKIGSDFYKSKEQVITVDSAQETIDLELSLVAENIPDPVTATFNANNPAVVELGDGSVSVNIPANAISNDSNDTIKITVAPQYEVPDTDTDKVPTYGVDIIAYKNNMEVESQFSSNITVTQCWNEDQMTDLGLTDDDLSSKYWDENAGAWISPGTVTADDDNNCQTSSVNHLTTFSLTSSDMSAPTVTLTSPADNTTVQVDSLLVEGTVSDSTATVTIALDGTSVGAVSVDSTTGAFSEVVTGLSIGTNTVTIDAENGVGEAETVSRAVVYSADVDEPGGATGIESTIVTIPHDGAPHVRVFEKDGTVVGSFFAYNENLSGDFNAITADVTGDGNKEILTSPGEGFASQVRVFDNHGGFLTHFFAYQEEYRGGMKMKVADVTGDGQLDIVTQPDKNGGPNVRVFTYNATTEAFELVDWILPYGETYRGEFTMLVNDLDGDDAAEIITSPLAPGGPNVRVYTYNASTELLELVDWTMTFDDSFQGGVNITVGNVQGDSNKEIIVSPASEGGPQIRIYEYDGTSLSLLTQFWSYAETYRGGVEVKLGNIDNNGNSEIITTPTAGGPHVRVFTYNAATGSFDLLDHVMAYQDNFRGGVTIAVSDLDYDGYLEIVTSPRVIGGAHVRVWEYDSDTEGLISMADQMVFPTAWRGKMHVVIADLEGDGTSEILVSPLNNGGPHVQAFGYTDDTLTLEANFMAYPEAFQGGVELTTGR